MKNPIKSRLSEPVFTCYRHMTWAFFLGAVRTYCLEGYPISMQAFMARSSMPNHFLSSLFSSAIPAKYPLYKAPSPMDTAMFSIF